MRKFAPHFIFTLLFAMVIASFAITGCTKNKRVKNLGGSMTIELPVNQKFVNVTWKDNNLWYLTTPMESIDTPKTYIFHEKSKHGILEGTVTFKEIKK